MWNRIQKYIIGIGSAIGVFSLLLLPQSTSAEDCTVGPIILEVPFNNTTTSEGLPEYIADMYRFLVLAAAIAAVVMIMFSGLKWASAAGNSAMISDAKERIKSAFFGLAIALASYMVLVLINPNLVQFPSICPDSLDFSQQYGNWIQCADRKDSSCDDVQYCNYSDTIDNECSCDNIGSDTGSYYVCRPATNGIVPPEGVCKNTNNCVNLEGMTCIGNDDGNPGICQVSTEGKKCDPNSETASCEPGQTCTEEKYTFSSNGWFCMSNSSREAGEYCTADSQCASNICDSASSNLCLDGEGGSACRTDDDCSTGYECDSGACTGKAEGDGCDTNADCQNTDHPDNFCVTSNNSFVGWNGTCYDGSEGDICDGSQDCATASPYCVDTWGYNECYDGSSGDPCRDNSECVSGTCNGSGTASVGECT